MPLEVLQQSTALASSIVLHANGDIWRLQLHPDIVLPLVGLAFCYLWAITKLGPRRLPPGEKPATRRQFICFSLGLVSLGLVLDGPVHTVAESYWYNLHMAQHFVLTLISPALILLGTPAWLLRLLIQPKPILTVVRFITRPLLALVAFNAVVVLTHLPSVVDLTLTNEFFHAGVHTALLGTAALMWWPVIGPLPELPSLSYPATMLYLFAQSLLPTVPASFLTFSSEPIYEFYANAPRLGGLDAITDQRIGGLIMKLLGGFFLWGIITVVFFRWYQKDEAENPYVLKWSDVEREREDMGLTKQ
jgi:putative membrane protein